MARVKHTPASRKPGRKNKAPHTSSSAPKSPQSQSITLSLFLFAPLDLQGLETLDSSHSTNDNLKSFSLLNEFSGDSKQSPMFLAAERGRQKVKTPPSAEIEEFFAMAEKYEQKRLAENTTLISLEICRWSVATSSEEFSLPLQVTPLFRSLAAGIPNPQFSESLFDGHNGFAAAIYAKENLLNNVLSAIPSDLNRDEWIVTLPRALVAGFVKTDKDFQEKGTDSSFLAEFDMFS